MKPEQLFPTPHVVYLGVNMKAAVFPSVGKFGFTRNLGQRFSAPEYRNLTPVIRYEHWCGLKHGPGHDQCWLEDRAQTEYASERIGGSERYSFTDRFLVFVEYLVTTEDEMQAMDIIRMRLGIQRHAA